MKVKIDTGIIRDPMIPVSIKAGNSLVICYAIEAGAVKLAASGMTSEVLGGILSADVHLHQVASLNRCFLSREGGYAQDEL